jgi:hypothetical protein
MKCFFHVKTIVLVQEEHRDKACWRNHHIQVQSMIILVQCLTRIDFTGLSITYLKENVVVDTPVLICCGSTSFRLNEYAYDCWLTVMVEDESVLSTDESCWLDIN